MRWWNVTSMYRQHHHLWLSCAVHNIQYTKKRRLRNSETTIYIKKQDEVKEVEKIHELIGPVKLVFGILRSILINTCIQPSRIVQPWTTALGNTSIVSVALECTLHRMSQASSWFNAIDCFCHSFNSFVRSFAASPFSQPECFSASSSFFLLGFCSVVHLTRLFS